MPRGGITSQGLTEAESPRAQETGTNKRIISRQFAVECYSALKEGILLFAAKWIYLENIMLSEINKTKTSTTCSLICESKKKKM